MQDLEEVEAKNTRVGAAGKGEDVGGSDKGTISNTGSTDCLVPEYSVQFHTEMMQQRGKTYVTQYDWSAHTQHFNAWFHKKHSTT